MPTLKTRIQVTLSDRSAAAVLRLSELTHQSQSSIIGEMVDSSLPVLEALISAAETYQQLDASKQAEMRRLIEESEARIMPDVERLQRETLEAFGQEPSE